MLMVAQTDSSKMTTDDCKKNRPLRPVLGFSLIPMAALIFAACGKQEKVAASAASPAIATESAVTVGVTKVTRRNLAQQLKISSELVPFQEIDVYAKESGYIKQLLVDYGSQVKEGQVMAILEIPELEAQLQQDEAGIKSASEQVAHAQHDMARVEAQHKVYHLQYDRLAGVMKIKPGLVAQQEVDDAQGKDLASEEQLEATKSALDRAQSQLIEAKTKLTHDEALFAYSKITAPFAGVVTQRYANLGALMQAGTNSSTQAMPLVRLSQENLFRLAIPVPESAVRFIRVGGSVDVRVPALNRSLTGKVARFSVDVHEDTRTMHTEVDVPNSDRALIPGLYAEATITLERKPDALSVPLQALNQGPTATTVYVVTASGQIEERKVVIGMETDVDAEILSGVNEGDLVVVSDRSSLKLGEEVRPQVVDVLQYKEGKKD
jgi:RND family efflux transporter MFP subunit